ncbi:uncharacterized protein LOC143915232 [Arctopsyche grandis]|uniref:uncharacterized protein LOC143915232 n=1 Tax=Arctopsyche grandis TaxID=121162 RepID=UPI00406D6717
MLPVLHLRMSGFKELFTACHKLEKSLRNAKVGAVAYSGIEKSNRSDDEWEEIIKNKLNDIKLLNSKAILFNATVQKDNIEVDDRLTSEEAQLQLKYTIKTHGHWSNALKMKAISRVVYLAYKNNDEEKILVFKELLQKLSALDQILDKLNEKEVSKNKELDNVTNEWQNIATLWREKQKIAQEQRIANQNLVDDCQIKEQIRKVIAKMEILKNIQGRLLGSSITHEWMRNPGKLDEYLIASRKPPHKVEDFF